MVFTAAEYRTADIWLLSGILRQCEISSATHFYSTTSLVFTASPFSLYSCSDLTTTIIASWKTLIRLSFRVESPVTCTHPTRGTAVEDVNPYNKIFLALLFFPPSQNYQYNVLVGIIPVHVDGLWLLSLYSVKLLKRWYGQGRPPMLCSTASSLSFR